MAAILTPSTAAADPAPLTITVGSVAVLPDPTLVDVPARLACAPMVVGSSQTSASLRQAVSGRVAFGSGSPRDPIVCDGTPHTVTFQVWVDTSSPTPFRPGDATVQISAFLCPPTPAPISACQSGSSGIQVIRVTK